jgi:hypothetical protein
MLPSKQQQHIALLDVLLTGQTRQQHDPPCWKGLQESITKTAHAREQRDARNPENLSCRPDQQQSFGTMCGDGSKLSTARTTTMSRTFGIHATPFSNRMACCSSGTAVPHHSRLTALIAPTLSASVATAYHAHSLCRLVLTPTGSRLSRFICPASCKPRRQ